ncbi:hypothetical protein U1Q18_042922, partial [Sarracenia purpurea var. burkii]
ATEMERGEIPVSLLGLALLLGLGLDSSDQVLLLGYLLGVELGNQNDRSLEVDAGAEPCTVSSCWLVF